MAGRSVFCAALLIIILPASSRQAVAELAFAGAGASQCDLINSNLLGAAPIKTMSLDTSSIGYKATCPDLMGTLS
jgi:hypothetical protein